MGGATERSLSPAPTVVGVVPESAQQTTSADETPTSTEERRPEPSAATETVEPVVSRVEEEAPVEAGLVDIARILGAPTETVVWSNL
jgi:hypothetical protein